ncbi:MAG TPA: HAMP domain-containing sensor histidine kinase, partial [Candidatus Kryptonia bacterium]|nr:HAMP domain-containing sensor histidine kinase [Candidatus Kryptonia bacterium]
ALGYVGGDLQFSADASVMLLGMVVLALPLFLALPMWGAGLTAVAAGIGWWSAGGGAPDGLPQLLLVSAVGLASAAAFMRTAYEHRLRSEIADLTATTRRLTAANAAQAEASEVAEALFAATRDISTSLEATEVAARVARNAWTATQSIAAAVLLWDADREVFRIAAVSGGGSGNSEMQQLEVPLRTAAPLQSALDEGMADIPRSALRDPVLDALMRRWKAAAILAARLQRGDRLLGLVITARRTAVAAPAKACRVLSGIALQAASALESANLVNDLRTASSLREEFTATMSHELRTPLNVIIGYTEMQREGLFGDLSPEHLETLQRVHEQSLQLLELIQATLDVGRLERGLMTVELRDVSVQDVMAQLFAAVPPGWRKPSVQLSWRVDPAVPRIRSDAAKLQVIVRNLVHNALKFTDSGQVTVTVTADPNRERVHFVVQDSGRGIAAQDLNVIFEMFRQSSERDPAAGGVGLGLYIVKRLVALLGGEIDVRSAPGRGATFRVHLPIGGPHAAPPRNSPASRPTHASI